MGKHSRSAINYYYLCSVKLKVARQRHKRGSLRGLNLKIARMNSSKHSHQQQPRPTPSRRHTVFDILFTAPKRHGADSHSYLRFGFLGNQPFSTRFF